MKKNLKRKFAIFKNVLRYIILTPRLQITIAKNARASVRVARAVLRRGATTFRLSLRTRRKS